MNDPYAVLGVSQTATDEEVTKAYKTLAKRYHPDLHPEDRSAAARMSAVNKAYDDVKAMRQNGGAAPGAGAYAGQSAYGWDTAWGRQSAYERDDFSGFDPFDFYRAQHHTGGYRRRRSPGGVVFAVFLAFILFRLLMGLMLGGYTYNYYGSGMDGGLDRSPYGYYQTVPEN